MKECFKCLEVKPLGDFYRHKAMADGRLNKCKVCTRKDVKEREEELRFNTEWVEREKERQREKYYRLGYKDKHKPSRDQKRSTINRYNEKYPEKYKAKTAVNRFPKRKGYHLHHWSYREEHHKDVIELPHKDHSKIHRFMTYCENTYKYFRNDTGELLSTREEHEGFIKEILKGSS